MTFRKFKPDEQSLLNEIMYARRDVRGNRFINKPISASDLDKILDAGLMAPSVGFSQPWRIVIVKNVETRQKIAEIFKTENQKALEQFKAASIETEKSGLYQQLKLEGIFESDINLAIFYERREAPVLGQTSMPEAGEYSAVCAIQNMWLMARALNIGLGWVSILDEAKAGKLLGAEPNQKLVAYLCLGHVDKFYDRPELETVGWEQRKLRDEVIFEESLSTKEPQ